MGGLTDDIERKAHEIGEATAERDSILITHGKKKK